MKNVFFISLFFLGFSLCNAQKHTFGKVSKEELQEKYYPTDSSASAAILYRKEEVRFTFNQNNGFMQEREVEMRVKIYNKEGFDWATKKVYLFESDRGNNEQTKGLKGYTYNLEGGKIKESKLKKDAIFKEKISNNYSATSFTLPNIKEGCVIEYKYMVTSHFPVIDDVDLQFSIPVKKLDVTISTPRVFKYKKRLNPKAYFVPKYVESVNQKTLTARSKSQNYTLIGSGNEYRSSSVRYHDNVITFEEADIPALKTESFGGSLTKYKAKMSLELEAILTIDGIEKKSFSTSWEKVSKNIYESERFGGQLNKTSFYKDELNALANGVEDDFEKAFIVENLVKSKVKWNGEYGKYTQKGIRNAYKQGEGNSADINLLAIAMLRSLGVDANPVLISTRNNGVPLFPTREGFNYVICMVQSGDKYLLIDATEPFSTNNILPERVLNWKGLMLADNKSSKWINITPNKKSKRSIMLNVSIDDQFEITGKVRENYTSYLALRYRKRYTGLSTDDHIKSIENNKGDIEISDLVYNNDKNISKPVSVNYNYKLADEIEEIGDKLYFSPLLFLATKENPFKLEERKYPIDFVMPLEDRFIINIMLPEGYKVESLPKSEAFEYNGGEAKFLYMAKENGKYLQLSVSLQLNNTLIDPVDYKGFRDFYMKTIEKQAEQIVLTKA